MWQPVAVLGSILFFLAVGAVWPRDKPGIDWKVSILNVVTGGLLFALRKGVLFILPIAAADQVGGLIDLGALGGIALVQFLFVVLVLDFARYWAHYASHRVPILWSVHRSHHSSEHLNSTSGLRMHWVDVLILTAIPVVLFGLLFDISGFSPWVFPAALMVGAFFDAFEHANIRMDSQTWYYKAFNTVFNNPHFHSWHHTREGAYKDGNYGQALTIWDRMFGTDVTEDLPPETYGLGHMWIKLDLVGLQLLTPRDVPEGHSPHKPGEEH